MVPRLSKTLMPLALLVACGSGEAASEPEAASTTESSGEEATPAAAGEAPDRAHHMQATFWMALDARNALIDGDLDAAKQAASALAKHDYSQVLPADWKHWVGEMQKQADEVAVAGDLASASRAMGALGLACGNCHFEKRQGPAVDPSPDLSLDDEAGDTVGNRMYRHELAADELWLGLIKPSDKLWERGTITLTRAALEPPVKGGEEVSAPIAAEIERIRAVAKASRQASTLQERADHYGELLALCGGCHVQVAR